MVAMLATKAEFDKCHADAGSKLVVVGALALPPLRVLSTDLRPLPRQI